LSYFSATGAGMYATPAHNQLLADDGVTNKLAMHPHRETVELSVYEL
jgi:hypothetical protein